MIDHQLAARGLHDLKVLDAVSAVAREEFVPTALFALWSLLLAEHSLSLKNHWPCFDF